ncbi:aminotransferase class V-fold PLP-dependent enzyme [Reinekea marinisedimentorum]|uniref:Glutamate decarboxylase n=1 Tax=Reinekea marinisedimentorum TaxID=230495 RepID=A0A4R3ICK0_9GAMM|nr:aminotransferase class V-fold PLP-dependent enzyme [Reinekea marinisedimentorum]TCS43127.1 glutamate decarboxylase [Reinekea marinisedimentorum]
MIELQKRSGEAGDHWLQLFSQVQDSKLESDIDRLCRDFLCNPDVTSSVPIDQVIQKFDFVPLAQTGINAEDFVAELQENMAAHSINTGSPFCIGHMTALLPNFIRPLAKLVASLNQNQVKLETAQATTFFEHQALCQLHQAFYGHCDAYYRAQQVHSESGLGVMTSGGTLANTTALQCARNHSLLEFGNVEQEGLPQVLMNAGFRRSVVICSRLGHYSIQKSLGTLGIGRSNLLDVAVDAHQRMDLNALKAIIAQCQANNWHVIAIVAVAGTTECGAFDNIEAVADIAAEQGIHLHVDAAWGGAVIFSERHRHLLQGIERADSITVDAHKQLYTPLGSGIVLFRNPDLLHCISTTANYIIRKGSRDLGRHSLEGSRPAMVIYLQAVLQLLGRQGLGSLLEKNIETCGAMAAVIADSEDFELLTQPQSNIFLYRYMPPAIRGKNSFTESEVHRLNEVNIAIQETQKQRGRSLVSRTLHTLPDGQSAVALRVVIANPLTEIDHCVQVLDEQRSIAQRLI